MLGCGPSKERLLLASGHSSLVLSLPSCALCALSSQSCTHRAPPGLCWPFQEPWAALGVPPCPPTSPGIFGKAVFQCFLDFPLLRFLFWDEEKLLWLHGVLVWGISNSQKGACSSGYAHFKMCIYEFKMTNIFLLGCFIFGFFFSQISSVMSWSFDSPTDKTVVLWDSFWKLFREITVGFLRKLVRVWKDHRKVFSLRILSRILWREGKNPTPNSNERIF